MNAEKGSLEQKLEDLDKKARGERPAPSLLLWLIIIIIGSGIIYWLTSLYLNNRASADTVQNQSFDSLYPSE